MIRVRELFPSRTRPKTPLAGTDPERRRAILAAAARELQNMIGELVDDAQACPNPEPCDHCFRQLERVGDMARATTQLLAWGRAWSRVPKR